MSHLLIVDDEPEYLDELIEALGFDDLKAHSARSAAQALELVHTHPRVNVVLTDIRMPDLDGIRLLNEIQLRYPERAFKFIVMTGHASSEDITRAVNAGVEACLPKPLVMEELQRVLSRVLAPSDGDGKS
ncbi:response regulator [Roseixanthobacter pseudopolyaromaticivorans]|uniref:response regulator n=1 Tax=Xanthobacteraceae TaxID=335928 RepID=UPI00372C3B8F